MEIGIVKVGFPKTRGTFLEAPDLGGPSIYGNCHLLKAMPFLRPQLEHAFACSAHPAGPCSDPRHQRLVSHEGAVESVFLVQKLWEGVWKHSLFHYGR